MIISAPIFSSPEGSLFYPPVVADPNPAAAGSIFQGSFSVWRTQDWGGDRAFLEANCPEFTTFAGQPGCGNFAPIGPPNATDLTDTTPVTHVPPLPPVYGGTRIGGAVAWIARAPQNTGSIWAATSTGRVFITENANDPAMSVVWNRADVGSIGPNRFVTAMYIEPTSARRRGLTPATTRIRPRNQGVFEATWSGSGAATLVDRSYNLPDFPVTAVVRDDVTSDLRGDFGVMKLQTPRRREAAGGALPMVEVSGLTIVPSSRSSTPRRTRSAWSLTLP